MKSPELYTILKLDMTKFIQFDKDENNKTVTSFKRDIQLNEKELKSFEIKQQFNHLFRIIKNNKTIHNKKIEDVIFIDCHRNKSYPNELDGILRHGVSINGKEYKYWGKSASMSRNGILGLVSVEMYDIVESHAMMEITFEKTVLSKFEAYKCLLLSSCFTIEEELPYMIVVDDYDKVIKDVHIKYCDEQEIEYVDKETGELKIFKEKVIKEGIKDISITTNDGSGLCSLEIAKHWGEYLNLGYTPCAIMLRVPYIKGIAIAMDFKTYYKEHGITEITDIWGHKHNVDDIDVILTKSQFKGYKYFGINKDYSDWERYLGLLKKYNYCMGIAKVNYSHEKEPKMTRCNYQTLQTLDITSDELIDVSSYTRKWVERILAGDPLYVFRYLGIGEETVPLDDYMKAILYEPNMVNDVKIRKYLYHLLECTIDEIKIGKVHVKGAFKILIPDVIMMLEYIGGMEVKGCLKAGEMFAKDHNGEYLLNRNPHLSASEHVILNAIHNNQTDKWLSHLEGVCMLNGYDVTAQRCNGADFDGDLILVHNNSIFMKGVHRDLPIVLDIEDKITAQEYPYTLENIIDFTKKSLDSRIGEISNCGTSYVNKYAKDEATKKKYEDYCCLLSILNGKEIDYQKTGIRWNVPRKISKFAKPLPYFMKYKYDHLKSFDMSRTKMNEHCWFIERWQTKLKFDSTFVNTSQYIINRDIPFDNEKYEQVVEIFKQFRKEEKKLKQQDHMAKHYDKYTDFFEGYTKAEVENTFIDWDSVYDKYKLLFEDIVPNQQELANYLTELIYNKLKGKGTYYQLLWNVAQEGILKNLEVNRQSRVYVPVESTDGTGEEYLGRYYNMTLYKGEI